MSPADPGVDFRTTPRRWRRNEFWLCPRALRPDADAVPPVFAVPLGGLGAALERVLAREPRLRERFRSGDGRRRVLEQRSRRFGFPDLITIELIELGPGRSTLAMHSGAVHGVIDLGVNRARVRRWLAAVRDELGAAGTTG